MTRVRRVRRVTEAVVWRVRRRVGRVDGGRAIIEFLAIGMLVLLPLMYLVITLARVQAAAFAVSAAAREAGRAYTTAATEGSADARARAAAALSFEDYDFGSGNTLAISCDGSPCLRPSGRVEIRAQVSVQLPLVPDFLAGAIPTSVPVSATHVATVDRFRGR